MKFREVLLTALLVTGRMMADEGSQYLPRISCYQSAEGRGPGDNAAWLIEKTCPTLPAAEML